jgi:hypothetical protein
MISSSSGPASVHPKTEAKWVIDADRVRTFSIAYKRLEVVPRGRPEIIRVDRCVKHHYFWLEWPHVKPVELLGPTLVVEFHALHERG